MSSNSLHLESTKKIFTAIKTLTIFYQYSKLAKTNEPLRENIENPLKKNSTYLTSLIQNQITNIKGYNMLQVNIVKNHTRLFLFLADEVESYHVEQLLLCIRFVDDNVQTV